MVTSALAARDKRHDRGAYHAGSEDTASYRRRKRVRVAGRDARFIGLHRTNRRTVLVRHHGDGRHSFPCHVYIAAAALCQRGHLLTRRGRVSRISRETGDDEHGSAFLRSILLSEC